LQSYLLLFGRTYLFWQETWRNFDLHTKISSQKC